MSDQWIICTDLDRTLLPNGDQKESSQAREQFRQLAAHPGTIIVYASGRDAQLVEDALAEWDLPFPDYLIADVGSTIYTREQGTWQKWESWRQTLRQDWNALSPEQIFQRLPQIDGLRLQPPHQQEEFKLSFFVEPTELLPKISELLVETLTELDIASNCIPSINEHENHGLIDILPAKANKLLAIRFLVNTLQLNAEQLLYSGDSGNDMEVLASEYKSVLVANATQEVKELALREAQNHNNSDSLYLAKGDLPGLNGCYAAGIIEGFDHFFPEFKRQVPSK
ncbi:HAD-IIB family hydrolase [Vibrio sp. RC27]